MTMKPLGDQVLLQEREKKEKTTSGIILMNGAEGSYVMADVIAVGEGLFTQTGDRIPMTVKVEDEVYVYKSNLGENKSIILEDTDYMLIRESEIGLVNSK